MRMDRNIELLENLFKLAADIQHFATPQDELSSLINEHFNVHENELQEDDLEFVTTARKVQHLRTDQDPKK